MHKIVELLFIPRITVRNILRRYQEVRDTQNRSGRRRKKTATIPKNKRKVKARIRLITQVEK
jgi:hypothetical protein